MACKSCRSAKTKCHFPDHGDDRSCQRCRNIGLDCHIGGQLRRGRKAQERLSTGRELLYRAISLVEELRAQNPATHMSTDLAHAFQQSSSTRNAIVSSNRQGALVGLEMASSTEPFAPSFLPSPEATETLGQWEMLANTPYPTLTEQDSVTAADEWSELSRWLFGDQYELHRTPRVADQYYRQALQAEVLEDVQGNAAYISNILNAEVAMDLIDFYFDHLHQFSFHLQARLHTYDYLAIRSPFLLATVCAISACFDYRYAGIAQVLMNASEELSYRIHRQGAKSREIIQALCLLAHWGAAVEDGRHDRTWSWIGQAIRMGTELNYHNLDNSSPCANHFSCGGEADSPCASNLDQDDRRRTWCLLYLTDITMFEQTGRPGSIAGSIEQVDWNSYLCKRDHKLAAIVSVRQILATAIAYIERLRHSANPVSGQSRADEVAGWIKRLAEWRLGIAASDDRFLQLMSFANEMMLRAMAMRILPPRDLDVRHWQAAATEVIRIFLDWPATELAYLSNFSLVKIAYAVTVMVKSSGPSPRYTRWAISQTGRTVQERMAEVGRRRYFGTSMATLHSDYLSRLLDHFESRIPSS